MRDIIRTLISEQFGDEVKSGCNNFAKESYDYKWCKFAENKLNINIRKAANAIERYKTEYMSTWSSGLRAVKYDKTMKFFNDRRSDVIEGMKKFQESCPKLYNHIINRMVKFTESYVILNEKGEYDLLNKLNTNWSALAFLMTKEIPQELKTVDWPSATKYFFDRVNAETGLTPFEKTLSSLDKMDNDLRDKINLTIKKTSTEGQKIEDEFFQFMKKFTDVIQYSGDYSFMDMMGIDMVVKSPQGEWIPVQVKKFGSGCNKGWSRVEMCDNWCVSWEKNDWIIRTYVGDNQTETHIQPKNLENSDGQTYLEKEFDRD